MFQREKPLIHKVHYEQVKTVKKTLSYFVLPSKLVDVNSDKALKKLWITWEWFVAQWYDFIGSEAKKIVKHNVDDNAVKEFTDVVRKCYLECSEFIAQKLPLDNPWSIKTVTRQSTAMSTMLLWCLHCWLWACFTAFSSVSFVDFEQVNADCLDMSLLHSIC